MGPDIIRLELQRPAVAGHCLVQLPLLLENNAQVIVCLGKIRLQFQDPAVAGHRLVQLPLFVEGVPRLLCASAKSGFRPSVRR